MRPIRWTVVVLAAVAIATACRSDGKGATPARDSVTSDAPDLKAKPSTTSGMPGRVATGAAGPRKRVLFLGTSLTAGLGLDPDSAYPQLIQMKIDARALPYQIVNAGVSGETSAGLLRRLDWVLQDSAAVIVVETGANDGLRGQPVVGTKATIGEVLTRIAAKRPEAKVVLVQMEAMTNLGAEYTRSFHAMFPSLATEHGVTLLPFLLDSVAGRPDRNQSDGVHPNLAGERIVAANVWKGLLPLLEKR